MPGRRVGVASISSRIDFLGLTVGRTRPLASAARRRHVPVQAARMAERRIRLVPRARRRSRQCGRVACRPRRRRRGRAPSTALYARAGRFSRTSTTSLIRSRSRSPPLCERSMRACPFSAQAAAYSLSIWSNPAARIAAAPHWNSRTSVGASVSPTSTRIASTSTTPSRAAHHARSAACTPSLLLHRLDDLLRGVVEIVGRDRR